MLFCEVKQNQLKILRKLLLFFEAILDAKVNFDKSELVPIGIVLNTRQLDNILDCKTSFFPMTYLDFPLGAASMAISIWDSVIEKIEHR